MSLCVLCQYRPVARGRQKYCRDCACQAKALVRRLRRARLKAQQAPIWQRNGWSSVEQFRQYHRAYMQAVRARRQEEGDVIGESESQPDSGRVASTRDVAVRLATPRV